MKFRSVLLLFIFTAARAIAQEPAYPVTFFVNSQMEGDYFFSKVSVVKPSSFNHVNGRIPVSSDTFHTPGNSLRFSYSSHSKGHWGASLHKPEVRGQDFFIKPRFLSLWIYHAKTTASQPALLNCSLVLNNKEGSGSVLLPKTAVNKWKQVIIPLENFKTANETITGISFSQNPAVNGRGTFYIDDIEFLEDTTAVALPAVNILEARAYSKHVDISWQPVAGGNTRYIKIYRSSDGTHFKSVGVQNSWTNRYADFTGETGKKYFYKISSLDKMYNESALSTVATAATRAMSDDELLTMVQEAAFRYYWEGAEKVSGLAKENIPGRSNMLASGASGFGIMALLVGAERKFITREQLADRFVQITSFLEKADKFHGAFAHFIDGPTGKAEPFFGKKDNGGDLVETSFLIQGLLAAKTYFNKEDAGEKKIRESITRIWQGVEWDWYRRYPDNKYLLWHWSPDQEWVINHSLIGWNETMVTYLLAIASPTHPVPASMYYSGWASQDTVAQQYRTAWGGTTDGSMYSNGKTYQGIKLDVGVSNGGPLFFTHYSYLGYDPHFINDKYSNYFTNNQHIAQINHRYCVENPGNYKGYGDSCWGLTASDGPYNYSADEPVLRQDKGKIAPTGAVSSFPYTPQESMKALKNYYNNYGKFLWGEYGFRDAFNLSENWCSALYMGLNQAPMVVMIENHRTGLIWKLFMNNPEIKEGLKKIQDLQTP